MQECASTQYCTAAFFSLVVWPKIHRTTFAVLKCYQYFQYFNKTSLCLHKKLMLFHSVNSRGCARPILVATLG